MWEAFFTKFLFFDIVNQNRNLTGMKIFNNTFLLRLAVSIILLMHSVPVCLIMA